MKTQLSSLEVRCLVKELSVIINGRIDKIFQEDKKEFYFQFHVSGKGKKILRITDKLMYFVKDKPETEAPQGFCMFLRKHLDNSRLREISQKEPERIVELIFETKNGIRKVVVELFGGGNLLVLDENDIILSAAHYEKYKDRDVLAKSKYSYPKMEYNLFEIGLKDIEEVFKRTTRENLVKCLAIDLGFGGIFSEEICLLSGINKNEKAAEIKEKQISEIHSIIKKLINKKTNPVIVYKDKKAVDVFPFPLDSYKEMEIKKFESFNEALDSYFTYESHLVKKKESPYESQIKELKRIIGEQEDTIKSLSKKADESKEKGELVYNNYQMIKEVLDEISKASKKYSWEEIKEKLKGHRVIKDLDVKEKTVVIQI